MLEIGLSPCPNDTYIFHALLQGLVNDGIGPVRGHFADVEQLNKLACKGALPVTKVSLGVMPQILDQYTILSAGAALGWGCGPLVVARSGERRDWSNATIAIPGQHTTANLLLGLPGDFGGRRVPMLFSDIMPAVARGDVDLGVIIHEGRFTYGEYGLQKVLDLGQWWEERFHLPLPLGCIVVRRDLPLQQARAIERGIGASLAYANNNPQASRDFIASHAQELNEEVTRAHIRTFVTDYSLNLGAAGRDAIVFLLRKALGSAELVEEDVFLR